MADPTTVGELAIMLTGIKESMDKQFGTINGHLEKSEGLPLKVQALEFRVADLEKQAIDRRLLYFTVFGWLVALAGVILGVVL